MATAASIESIIVLDCGSTTTRAVLIDLVDGRYRFIARGETFNATSNANGNLLLAVKEAIRQIETITGRTFLDDEEQIIKPEQFDGQGVDALLIVANKSHPLRLVLAGLSDQVSLASARRAIHSAYASVEQVISPETESDNEQALEETLKSLSSINPDVVVLTGGIDDGPAGPVIDLATLVSLGCSLIESPDKPRIVYAGNKAMRDEIENIIAGDSPLITLDNVRPSLEIENLEPLSDALNNLYRDKMVSQHADLDSLSRWSEAPVLTSAQALGYVIKYLAHMWGEGHNVLGVDIGGTKTTIALVAEDSFSLLNRTDLGVGRNIDQVLAQTGIKNILRWLPEDMDEETAEDRLLNKQIRSHSLPQTLEDLYLEQAAAREALRLTLAQERAQWQIHRPEESETFPEFEIIVGSGGLLAHAAQHGQVALVLLDAIQPAGITTLWLDATSLAIPVGALATVNPLAAAHVMEGDAFLNLCTVICPVGTGIRPGEVAMRITITYSDGRTLDVEIPFGSLEVIPLPLGEEASLEARPLKGFDVGEGPGKKRKIKRLIGGMMGLVIDARGRPITFPPNREDRLEKVRQWFSDIGA